MMSSLASAVVSYAVNALWEVPVIFAAAWTVAYLQRKIGPRAQHITWVAALVLAVFTPASSLCRAVLVSFSLPHAIAGHTSIAIATARSMGASSKGVLLLPAVAIVVLFCSYVGTLLYFAGRLIWSLCWTAALLRDSCPVLLNHEQMELWRRCKQTFSLGDVSIRSSQRVYGPVTVGFGRTALLLPIGFSDSCTRQDFLTAMSHEGAHIRRDDCRKNLFYEAVSLVIAFHPVTWLLKSQIAQTREMICDSMAVEGLIDSRDYAQSLLRLAAMMVPVPQANTVHAIGIFDANILEKRIMYMTKKKQVVTLAARLGLILPGALLLCSVAASGAMAAVSVEPQAQSSQSASRAYHVGGEVTPPKLVWSTDPVYPKSARKGKGPFEGVCVVKVRLNASGMPTDVEVVRSLAPDFDSSAVRAVRQYRFSPAMRSGVPVPVVITIEVNFKKY